MIMFIGTKEIKEEKEEGDAVELVFSDEQKLTINKNLYDLIKTETSREGNITDCVRLEVSKICVAKMAEFNLDINMAEQIAMGITNIVNNALEEATSKKFEVKNTREIKIKDIF